MFFYVWIISASLLLNVSYSWAQSATDILKYGKVVFEKKINLHAQFSNIENESEKESLKNEVDKFKYKYFELTFDSTKSLFKPLRSIAPDSKFPDGPADVNIVYHQIKTRNFISQKDIFNEVFLIKSKSRQVEWKITDEFREIIGFNCRRANAIIMDSLYVVAFFTNSIPLSYGPESFCGLPGLILGVALPREHVSWFATSFEYSLNQHEIIQPTKGKMMEDSDFQKYFLDNTKKWSKGRLAFLRKIFL